MKVAFIVTHLLGTGHLVRALTLARACAAAGHEARVVSGGIPVPHLNADGVQLVQVSPVRSDGINFTRLLDSAGKPVSDSYIRDRISKAVAALEDFAPDVIITELFPFGRRSLGTEFKAILETARNMVPQPLICCSIRDILAPPSKPAKAAAVEAVLAKFYDAVLVHSDATLMPLDISWPVTPAIRRVLHYTGFVAPEPAGPHPETAGADSILVSAGGGEVGSDLYQTALEAARRTPELSWHLLVGGAQADARVKELRQAAPANVRVETARPDFRSMLHHAKASVSMSGYNTSLDVLQSGAPAVFVPFDEGGETEQTLRAEALTRLDGIVTLSNREMNATSLVNAIQAVVAAPRRAPLRAGMDGADATVRILSKLRDARV